MINLGLSAARQRAFEAALGSSARIDVQVTLTDLEHNVLHSGLRVLDGQVNIDATAPVTRSLTVSLLDPDRAIGFDSNDPLDGQVYLDRMLRVEYGVEVARDDFVYVPIFHGPVTSVSRDVDVLEVEAQGKETLARRASWKPRTWQKGLTRVGVIRSIMEELTGEDRFNLPTWWPARLAKPLALGRRSSPWTYALHLADSMRAQVWYDGDGTLRLRQHPVKHVYVFRDGPGGVVVSRPKWSQESEDVVNTVHVVGGVPKGAKSKIDGVAYVPSWHRLSPHRLGRNGVPRYLVEEIEDDTLRSQKEVEAAAVRRVRELLIDASKVEFECLPVPHLDPKDVVRIDAGGLKMTFRLEQMTIPLSHNSVSTVGYLRRVSFKGKIPRGRPVRYKK